MIFSPFFVFVQRTISPRYLHGRVRLQKSIMKRKDFSPAGRDRYRRRFAPLEERELRKDGSNDDQKNLLYGICRGARREHHFNWKGQRRHARAFGNQSERKEGSHAVHERPKYSGERN